MSSNPDRKTFLSADLNGIALIVNGKHSLTHTSRRGRPLKATDMPCVSNFSGCSAGYRTTSCNSCLAFSRPPISSQVTVGTPTTGSRRRWTCRVIAHRNGKRIHRNQSKKRMPRVRQKESLNVQAYLFKINIVSKLRVFRVDMEDLQEFRWVRNSLRDRIDRNVSRQDR